MKSFVPFIFIFFLSSFGLAFFIIINDKIKIDRPHQIQDAHHYDSSRMAGFVFVFSLIIINSIFNFFDKFYISCLILISIPAFIEDLKLNISPLIRLIIIFFACIFLIINLKDLPYFNSVVFDKFLNNNYFQIVFYSICLTALINGQNIIDGTNGHSAFTALSILVSLLFLSIKYEDQQLINMILIVVVLIISFLIFNFPLGKIFLGDVGSYFLGLTCGYITLNLFSRYPELLTWQAVLILFYPSFEVMFSYIRKIFSKKSPFYPDILHLHLKSFHYLREYFSIRKANNLVVVMLIPVWFGPTILLYFFFGNKYMTFVCILLMILIYLLIYILLPKPKLKI